MTKGYRVRFVDDALLAGRDYLLCDRYDDGVTLYVRRSIRTMADAEAEAVWEDAWAAFRELIDLGSVPEQRAYAG